MMEQPRGALGRLIRRLGHVLRLSRHDADRRDEIATHRSPRQAALERQGLAPDAAACASRRAMGNDTLAREDVRGIWTMRWLEDAWRDVRLVTRSLRRSAGFSVVSITTIALGIAAATTLFSVVKAVLLNPLPYPDPDRLVWVASTTRGREIRTSAPDFDDWRRQTHSFSSLALFSEAPAMASSNDAPVHVAGAIVSEDFFDVMGVQPARGRTFTADEHQPGAILASIVISHGFWQRAYGGDPDIIGRRVTVLGFPSTVIGVMPAGFTFPASTDLWASARAIPDGNARTAHNFWVVGRLAPGVTTAVANADMSVVARELYRQHPGPYQTEDATVVPLTAHLVGSVRTPLLMLFGAVGLLLLIVCVNVANLLLVRTTARSRELAVRTALGARRRDLIRQMLAEAAVLALAGGAIGLLIAFWSMDLVRVLLPSTLPRGGDVRVDAGVAAFAAAAAAAVCVLFATLPAWRASRPSLNTALTAATRSIVAGERPSRTQSALVVSEVALSLMLLAAAGLLVDSFARLRSVDAGFSSNGVLAATLTFPMSEGEVGRLAGRYGELLGRVRALPGVEAAGILKDLPFDPIQRDGNFFIASRPDDRALSATYQIATPGTMEALRVPLVRGRNLSDGDTASAPGVAVVNAEMARRFWPERDPVGERIWFNSFEPKARWLTVVGVVGDVRQRGPTEPVPPIAYVNYAQVQIQAQLGSGTLIVRSSVAPETLIPAIRDHLRAVQPSAAASFRTMEAVVAAASSRQRFQMQVLAAFAALAVVLAIVGLYGVLSYTVAMARRAIGIRLALGAEPRQVFRMVTVHALVLTVVGAVVGLGGCLALRQILRAVLFETAPSDPHVLSLAVVLMLAVAVAASWLPARRAMRVEPAIVLREE